MRSSPTTFLTLIFSSLVNLPKYLRLLTTNDCKKPLFCQSIFLSALLILSISGMRNRLQYQVVPSDSRSCSNVLVASCIIIHHYTYVPEFIYLCQLLSISYDFHFIQFSDSMFDILGFLCVDFQPICFGSSIIIVILLMEL
jgi:hypothetical protein